jgi:DNA polymerase-3 subunit alpha
MSDFEPVVGPEASGKGEVLFGLSAVRNVGEGLVEQIVREREANGPFDDFYDFANRVEPQVLNKRTLESLIKAGAFESMGHPRKGLLEVYAPIVDRVVARRRKEAEGQFELFAELEADTPGAVDDSRLPIPNVEFEKKERLVNEREMLGLYVSEHPLMGVDGALRRRVDASIGELEDVETGTILRVGGLVTNLRRKWTKKGDLMAIFALEDLAASAEVVVFPKTMAAVGHVLEDDAVVVLKVRVDNSGEQLKLVAMEVEKLDVERLENATLRVKVPANRTDPESLRDIRELLGRYPGRSPVYLHIGDRTLKLPDDFAVEYSSGLLAELRIMLGNGCILP